MTNDLIIFGEDWKALPSSSQHLISQLAKQRKVVWINSIGLRRPRLTCRDIKRVWKKLIGVSAQYRNDSEKLNPITHSMPSQVSNQQGSENFIIVNPHTLPAPTSKLGRWLATKLLMSQLKPVLQRAALNHPIVWTALPTAVDVADKLTKSALVYYCGDDFSALAGVDHHTVSIRENELVDKADLIIASSELLVEKFPSSKTKLLKHGVDFSRFSQPTPRANDLPDDGRPIAGFYGSISKWMHIDLLVATIAKMPDWQFIFIGQVEIDVSALKTFNNVTFLGPRPHHALPSYCQHWTVSLLPFVDNAQIRACNPLKLSEYLASGKPIVSTSFPAVSAYSGLVQLADTRDAMVAALWASEHLSQLSTLSNTLASAMQARVANSSWTQRAQQVSTWLDSL
jgi:glycosyltransferase involved in cell wall biosynthesis